MDSNGPFSQSDVIDMLAKRNIPVTRHQIHRAIETGKLPKPRKDGSNSYVYTQEHVDKLAEIFG